LTRTCDAGCAPRLRYTVPWICPLRPPKDWLEGTSNAEPCACAEGVCVSKAIIKRESDPMWSFDIQACRIISDTSTWSRLEKKAFSTGCRKTRTLSRAGTSEYAGNCFVRRTNELGGRTPQLYQWGVQSAKLRESVSPSNGSSAS